MSCQLQRWQPWPAMAFLLASVFFVFVFFFLDGKFEYFAVIPTLRDYDQREQQFILLFDTRNATSSSLSPSSPLHDVDQQQIESNAPFINISSSLSSSSQINSSTIIPETGLSAGASNQNDNSFSLSQTTKNSENSVDNHHVSHTQQQQQQKKKKNNKNNNNNNNNKQKPTAKPKPHYFMEISLSHDNIHSLGESAPEYISTTLDWWPIGTKGWDNSSVLNANLSHPRLVAAASGLRPYILRIGGSQADEILYNMVDEQPREGSKRRISGDSNTTIIYHHVHDEKYDDFVANECQTHPQKCLTRNRWDAVLNFAQQTGARIVFTIAYIRHTRGENHGEDHTMNDAQDWDSRNARRFLEYTFAHKHAGMVYGFELGNELRHKKKISNITRVVNAYRELGSMVKEIWTSSTNSMSDALDLARPKILGPASTGVGETAYLLSQIGPYIQIASYHKYHGGGDDPNLPSYAKYPSFYPHPMKLSGPGEAVKKYLTSSAAGNHSSVAPLWIGEGAMAYNSGLRGLTDSFHGSLWFANILGVLTKTKPLPHSVYCRQSLLGGYYELISHESLIPNPDYWVAYLWKRLVGQKAIGPIVSPQRKDSVKLSSYQTFGCCKQPGGDVVLIHSFCAKSMTTSTSNGDVVFIVINTSDVKAMHLNIPMSEKNRTEYILTPNNAQGLKSRQVFLNGQKLFVHHENDTDGYVLPDIRELGVSRSRGEQFQVPPISIAFLVVHGSEIKQCMSAN